MNRQSSQVVPFNSKITPPNKIVFTDFKGYFEVAKLIGYDQHDAILAANNAVKQLHGVDLLDLIDYHCLVGS